MGTKPGSGGTSGGGGLGKVLRKMRAIAWTSLRYPGRLTYVDQRGNTHHPTDPLFRAKRQEAREQGAPQDGEGQP